MSDWRDKAACAQVDPEMFFPEPKWNPAFEAKKICATCPVAGACLQDALDNNEEFGIWGGLSVEERKKLRKAARRSA